MVQKGDFVHIKVKTTDPPHFNGEFLKLGANFYYIKDYKTGEEKHIPYSNICFGEVVKDERRKQQIIDDIDSDRRFDNRGRTSTTTKR